VKIINDVSGGRFDEDMFSLISQNPEIKYVFMYAKNES
jgi:dihydropteroate synthase